MKRFMLLVGARPNFMKVAPLHRALLERGADLTLVHTGQHQDINMSDIFFTELAIPAPDVHLGIGFGDRLTQTKKIVDGLTPLLRERQPDALVVVGDVTSTAAGAMAGTMAGVPVVHVEAGLRSFNWRMPEELNRMIADHHATYLFVSDPSGIGHLKSEAIPEERIHFVGNIMIDTLRNAETKGHASDVLSRFGISSGSYGVLTLHRPENVDDVAVLKPLWETLNRVAATLPIIFPVHPRTQKRLAEFGIPTDGAIRLVDPVGYFDMLALTKNAKLVLTDSGGVQEETTVLGIPCITLREETERPVTVTVGTSEVVGRDREAILAAVDRVLRGEWKKGGIPELWDGSTAARIADILMRV
jgi:UDP-N-acetylglucosamine 2-epimerase (non-hydrolysing)